MQRCIYRYVFREQVDLAKVAAMLVSAVTHTESLYGEARTRLETAHHLDESIRTLIVDASSDAGGVFNKLFCGLITRELGPDHFAVRRVDHAPQGGSIANR